MLHDAITCIVDQSHLHLCFAKLMIMNFSFSNKFLLTSNQLRSDGSMKKYFRLHNVYLFFRLRNLAKTTDARAS